MTAVNYQQMMTGGSQKKKKKQPSMAQAQGAGAQQPQTYGQPSMAQAQGQDPLVSAIAAGSQAQNQQPSMAQAQGGTQPEQQQPTMQQAQGGATPPPPPPPPPAPSMAQAQQQPMAQQSMAQAQGGMTGPQQTMPQAQSPLAGMDLSSQLQQGPPQLSEDEFMRRALESSNQSMSPEQQEQMAFASMKNLKEAGFNQNATLQSLTGQLQPSMAQAQQPQPTNMSMAIAQMPQAEKQAQIQNLQRALQNPLHEDKDEIRRQLEMFGGQEAPAGSFDFSGQIADLNQALAEPNRSPEERAGIRRQLALMGQSGNAQVQPAIGDLGGIRGKAVANGVGPATMVNPTSDPNFGRPLATMVNPTSDPNFGRAPAPTVNPISDPGFVSDLAGGRPVTQNPLSDPLVVRAMEEERMSQPVTENPLSDPGFVKDLAEGRSNQPITENPLSDPSFVQGLAADATTPTVNPISDPSFVQGLAADATQQPSMAEAQAPTTPADIAGAGADMAAAQNVVTPEAEPMPGTLEDALRQQYMSRVGGTDDPILASQLADQQMRQNEQRKALVEQLGRYGVLRGGGDTAAALARMGEGDERNRLALEAQAAQRRQQDLRDAQGFDIGQRGMGLQEDRSQQDTLTQALNRDIARAGQTGIFERDKTMASRKQAAELDALRRREERADAGLTGRFGEDGAQTLQAQRQEAELFGEVGDRSTLQSDIQRGTLGLGERKTGLAERTGAEDIRRSTAQRGAIEGQEGRAERQLESQLFGEVDDRQTLTGETTRSGLDTQDLQRRVTEAGQTGLFDTGAANMAPVQTQQAKALASELDTAALGRDATRAGLTGEFEEDPTLEARLREAAMTGTLDGQQTLAGRQADMDTIGAILAGADAELEGLDPLMRGLAGNIADETLSQDQLTRFLDEQSGAEFPVMPPNMNIDDQAAYDEIMRTVRERREGEFDISSTERANLIAEARAIADKYKDGNQPVDTAAGEYFDENGNIRIVPTRRYSP